MTTLEILALVSIWVLGGLLSVFLEGYLSAKFKVSTTGGHSLFILGPLGIVPVMFVYGFICIVDFYNKAPSGKSLLSRVEQFGRYLGGK